MGQDKPNHDVGYNWLNKYTKEKSQCGSGRR